MHLYDYSDSCEHFEPKITPIDKSLYDFILSEESGNWFPSARTNRKCPTLRSNQSES